MVLHEGRGHMPKYFYTLQVFARYAYKTCAEREADPKGERGTVASLSTGHARYVVFETQNRKLFKQAKQAVLDLKRPYMRVLSRHGLIVECNSLEMDLEDILKVVEDTLLPYYKVDAATATIRR